MHQPQEGLVRDGPAHLAWLGKSFFFWVELRVDARRRVVSHTFQGGGTTNLCVYIYIHMSAQYMYNVWIHFLLDQSQFEEGYTHPH